MSAPRIIYSGDGSSIAATLARPVDPELFDGYLNGEIVTPKAKFRPKGFRQPFGGRITPRRKRRPQDRKRALRHRRMLAATGPLPPHMAMRLTTAELAIARIIGDEVKAHGRCTLTKDEIADRTKVSLKTVQRAFRRLCEGRTTGADPVDGLRWITVQERPVRGRKNLPNIIKVVSKEWITWIERGPHWQPIGGHLLVPSVTSDRDSGLTRKDVGREATVFADELTAIVGFREKGHPAWASADPPRVVQSWLDSGVEVDALRTLTKTLTRYRSGARIYTPRYFTPAVKRMAAAGGR